MKRHYYGNSISGFQSASEAEVLGELVAASEFDVTQTQRDAWLAEIRFLKPALAGTEGSVYFEYSVPRVGSRIDVVLLIGPVIFVLEFKVGERLFTSAALDQVSDYALDLKNFHESSQPCTIVPVLVATNAPSSPHDDLVPWGVDKLFRPVRCNPNGIGSVLRRALAGVSGMHIDAGIWEDGRYSPTPTIVEAAMALYNGHEVESISRSDAGAINLSKTSDAIASIIQKSRDLQQKSICFLTGVPGAGKTLVGLNIATTHSDLQNDLYSVYLSGNGPLVAVLREALARDKVSRKKEQGTKIRKKEAMSEVKAFIQNVHNFRDECLVDSSQPPIEHVALFDEAQRAWTQEQTSKFMRQKKGLPNFNQSEPEFLISCLDRQPDWATIVCLVGGGQEINSGEAGISEWVKAIKHRFPAWHVYVSGRLVDSEYGAAEQLLDLKRTTDVTWTDDLHLSVSMRSFRAENVSLLVKRILDLDVAEAQAALQTVDAKYPIRLTRDLRAAKEWLRDTARGTERYGIVVSSQAERLKPHAIDVRSPMDPIHYFLDPKDHVRSSYYLEDVATEFHVQGLELDWACVTWDADFRYSKCGWEHWSFRGQKWTHIRNAEGQSYQKNAYRVLLTRARQGMVIVVPNGDPTDPTRQSGFYDPTYEYLRAIGLQPL
jgi:hypothetical protein